MDFKDYLKKYWFLGILAIALIVYFVFYAVNTYNNRTIYVNAKTDSDGKSIVLNVDDLNYYADDLYDELYDQIGSYTAYQKWASAVADEAIESSDSLTTYAANYASYISANNDDETIDSYLRSMGYENGKDDLDEYCLNLVKLDQLYSQFYKDNFDTYVPQVIEAYHPKKIYHILVSVADITEETDDDGNTVKVANMTEDEQAKLDAVLEALKTKDFETVAKEYSDDTTAEDGGYVGIYDDNSAPNKFVSEFSDACIAAEYGTISDPVLSQYGYHIIMVEEPTNDELKEDEVFMSEISSYYSYSNTVALMTKSDELGFKIENEDLLDRINQLIAQADTEINATDESEAAE